jgi:hypothetical protein
MGLYYPHIVTAHINTYPAINAGAKLDMQPSPSVDFLISPQGDIACSDEAEVGTSNS